MADFNTVLDPILDEMRAEFIAGGTGGSGEPLVGGDGITIAGGTFTATVAAVDGGRLTLSGGTATFNPVANIVNATGATVTLEPDTAYKITATTQAVTLNANVPASGQWGLEGHIELFVAGTGYVVTGTNVVLANALEPDAVNNCTVRFHDGYAIISVEDHVAGYIVTVDASSGAGSLAYGLATATNEYISVDASLNGQTLDLGGVTTSAGEKHVVGNGYTETIVSGGITCTSKTTFSNLSMDGVVAFGGTMTLGDVYIPSGSTVAVSGGGLAVERVSGDGGTINLGRTAVVVTSNSSMYASGCSFTSGGNNYDKATILASRGAHVELYDCSITGGTARMAAGILCLANTSVSAVSCTISGNFATSAAASGMMDFEFQGFALCSDCILGSGGPVGSNAVMQLAGSNRVGKILDRVGMGVLNITSGAIVDLTGNTNATPIGNLGGIVVAAGDTTASCTVVNSAGASVSITGGTYTAISNDGTATPAE